MNAMTRSALNAYSQVGVETSIASASPHRLIALLYEGALVAIATAKGHLERNEVGLKGGAISKAIAIIDEGLLLSLDEKAGGELAQNLKALYEYMSGRLLMANLRNDMGALDEVAHLLMDLKTAWDQIARQPEVDAKVAEPPAQRNPLSYGKA